MPMVRPRLRAGQGFRSSSRKYFSDSRADIVENTAEIQGTLFFCPTATMSCVAFVIRDFKPQDFETLWRIDQSCFPPGIAYSRAELKSYIRHGGSFTLVAEGPGGDGGEIKGFIIGHKGPTGHIITIDVLGDARRMGLGSLLLDAAENKLRDAGSAAVGLETAVDNISALSFYKRHGYSVVRTFPRYYSNGVDALVLRKGLT